MELYLEGVLPTSTTQDILEQLLCQEIVALLFLVLVSKNIISKYNNLKA